MKRILALSAALLCATIAVGGEYPVLPYVTRLDGTVYRGNDANRAVITNWQSQIARPAARPAPAGAADGDFHTIDILFIYDKPSAEYARGRETAWNGADALEVFSAKAVAKMNEIICVTDMDTNFWFRSVGVYETAVDGGTVKEVLQKAGARTGGYELAGEVRDRTGADIVVCVSTQSGGYGGLAPVNYYDLIMNGGEKESCTASVLASYSQTLAWVHEIGHLMSLNHYPPDGFDPASTWRGLGFLNKKSEADGHVFSSVMSGGYGNFCGGFSSRNHIYHGSMLSLSNHLDSTSVMLDVARHVAKWRETKVPETHELSFFPPANASISSGTHVWLKHTDPEARIYYKTNDWYGTGGFIEYTGPFELDASLSMNWVAAYAVSGGAASPIVDSSYILNTAYDDALGGAGLPWAVPPGAQDNALWIVDGGGDCMTTGGIENAGRNSLATLSTAVRGPATITFKHREKLAQIADPAFAFTKSSFAVWVDSSPEFAVVGGDGEDGGWTEATISVPEGFHAVDFVYTRRNGSAEEYVKVKDVAISSELSENPSSLSLEGGALPEILKWSTANWRDPAGLRYAGTWSGLSIPARINAATNLAISVDTPLAPQYLMLSGRGLTTLRGDPMDFSGPVALLPYSLLALDTIHSNGTYSVMAGAGLCGGGSVRGGMVELASKAWLAGGLSVDNLSLADGAYFGAQDRPAGNTVGKSLVYTGGGSAGVAVSNGVFTVGRDCDASGFADCPLLLLAGAGALALERGISAKQVRFLERTDSGPALRLSTNAFLEATERMDFMTPSGVSIALRDDAGNIPPPGRYLIARSAKISWTLQAVTEMSVADMLNATAPYGVEYSMESGDGDRLYATIADAIQVDVSGGPARIERDLDNAYVNIEVSNAGDLAPGEEAEILSAQSISGTIPNVTFPDSRTAAYSTVVNVSENAVKLVRTDFNFKTPDGAIAFSVPLEWAERCIADKPGDAMEAMRAPNAHGVAPWQAYLLGFAPEEADSAKVEAEISFENGVAAISARTGASARATDSVETVYSLLGAAAPGGEYAEIATGKSGTFRYDAAAGDARFFKIRIKFSGLAPLDSDQD